MSNAFDLEIPYFLEDGATAFLAVHDETLQRSPHHFIRIDIYPRAAPSHMRRHYGWWDIPLRQVSRSRTEITLFPGKDTLLLGGPEGRIEIKRSWKRLGKEPGYCMAHVSLWENSADPPRMLSVASYPHLLTFGSLNLPLTEINIPVTERCNLRCVMCPTRTLDDLAGDTSEAVLQPLLEAAPDLFCVAVQGLGESLLNKQLMKILKKLKRRIHREGRMGMTTNATLLDGLTAAKLIDTGIDFVYFSVDGAVKETYESIRVGADFEQVIANISGFSKLICKTRSKHITVMMNFVMQDRNIRELPALVTLAANLGVPNVTVSRCTGAESGLGSDEAAQAAVYALFREAQQAAEQYGITLNLPPLKKVQDERCLFMDRAVITAGGEVLPCHTLPSGLNGRRRMSFGSVTRNPLKEIWNSSEYKEFRGRVVRGDFPEFCAGCEMKEYLVP